MAHLFYSAAMWCRFVLKGQWWKPAYRTHRVLPCMCIFSSWSGGFLRKPERETEMVSINITETFWKVREYPPFQLLIHEGGLKSNSSSEKNTFILFSFHCKSRSVFQSGLWPFFLPVPPLCYVSHVTQNQQLIQASCLFVFFPLESCSICMSDKMEAEYILCSCLLGIVLTDSPLWQILLLTSVILLTLSLLCLLRVCFVPFRLPFSFCHKGVSLSFLTDRQLSRRAECHWMHRPAHHSTLMNPHTVFWLIV